VFCLEDTCIRPWGFTPKQLNQVHILTYCTTKFHLNINLPSTPYAPKCSLWVVRSNSCVRSSLSSLDLFCTIFSDTIILTKWVEEHNLYSYPLHEILQHFPFLRSKYSYLHLLRHLQCMFFLSEGRISHLCIKLGDKLWLHTCL
jgi:hypothetical protein